MVKIRLRRTGKKKQPSYRVVVADSRSPRDGKFIEIIGHYNPVQQPKVLNIKADRARYWLSVGAQPTDVVSILFKQVQVFDENGKVVPATAESASVAPTQASPAPAAAAPVAPVQARPEFTEPVTDEPAPAASAQAGPTLVEPTTVAPVQPSPATDESATAFTKPATDEPAPVADE